MTCDSDMSCFCVTSMFQGLIRESTHDSQRINASFPPHRRQKDALSDNPSSQIRGKSEDRNIFIIFTLRSTGNSSTLGRKSTCFPDIFARIWEFIQYCSEVHTQRNVPATVCVQTFLKDPIYFTMLQTSFLHSIFISMNKLMFLSDCNKKFGPSDHSHVIKD